MSGQDFPGLGYLRLSSLTAYFNDFNGNLDFYDRSNLADSQLNGFLTVSGDSNEESRASQCDKNDRTVLSGFLGLF